VTGITTRFFLSLGNVFSSLILGALLFGFFWIYVPSASLQLFKWASALREWIFLGNWPPQYEVALRFFVDERQIVYLGFVLATRILVGILIVLVYKLFGRKTQEEFSI
jgi:hypothetical protein